MKLLYFKNFLDIYNPKKIISLFKNSHNIASGLYIILKVSGNSKLFC